MSKHNPGPWRVDGQANDMAGSAIIRDAGGFPVASTRSWVKEQHEANARLVAAAPDLLEAAKSQVANIERWLDTGVAATPGESKYIYDALKAAIDKAEGKDRDVDSPA
jgi:hypothetical protein